MNTKTRTSAVVKAASGEFGQIESFCNAFVMCLLPSLIIVEYCTSNGSLIIILTTTIMTSVIMIMIIRLIIIILVIVWGVRMYTTIGGTLQTQGNMYGKVYVLWLREYGTQEMQTCNSGSCVVKNSNELVKMGP